MVIVIIIIIIIIIIIKSGNNLEVRKQNILSRVYGTWQPITRVLGPNEWVY
jgi:hypothetical protein